MNLLYEQKKVDSIIHVLLEYRNALSEVRKQWDHLWGKCQQAKAAGKPVEDQDREELTRTIETIHKLTPHARIYAQYVSQFIESSKSDRLTEPHKYDMILKLSQLELVLTDLEQVKKSQTSKKYAKDEMEKALAG